MYFIFYLLIMDLLSLFLWGYLWYVIVLFFMFIICFITFIWIWFKLRWIRDSLEDISDTFDEFIKKINQINLEKN